MSSSSRNDIEAQRLKLDAAQKAFRQQQKEDAISKLQDALNGLAYDAEYIEATLASCASVIEKDISVGESYAVNIESTLKRVYGLAGLCQKIKDYRDNTKPIPGSVPPDLVNDFNTIHQATVKDYETYMKALFKDFNNANYTPIPIKATEARLQVMQNYVSNPGNADYIKALGEETEILGKQKRSLARDHFWSGLQVMTGFAIVIAAVALFTVGLAILPYDLGVTAAGFAIPLAYAGFAFAHLGFEDIENTEIKSKAPLLKLHDNMKLFSSPKKTEQPSADSEVDAKPTPSPKKANS
jgi:hypothetical protein